MIFTLRAFVAILVSLAFAATGVTYAQPGTPGASPEGFVCPVTVPNNVDAPGDLDHYAADGRTWFENGIWISIPTDGTLRIGPDQQNTDRNSKRYGWGFEKLLMLRGEGVRGFVEITGQRLDQPSELTPYNDTAVEGSYGTSGFVPIALLVPGEGCWEFTATAGEHSATWTLKVKFVDYNPWATPPI